MALTILDVLENADYNLQNAKMDLQINLAKEQLHNALDLLNKDFGLDDYFDETKLTKQPLTGSNK